LRQIASGSAGRYDRVCSLPVPLPLSVVGQMGVRAGTTLQRCSTERQLSVLQKKTARFFYSREEV
jgi:hypothetical protein